MATRRLALIGAKVGPWVSIKTLPIPVLKVRGLGKGMIKCFLQNHLGERTSFACEQNGDYPLQFIPMLERIEWVQLHCTEDDSKVICEVISERVA